MSVVPAGVFARVATAVLIVLAPVALAAPAGAAGPAEQPVRLAIRPLGQQGSYFDLTLKPGQTKALAVQLGNRARTKMQARTYASDVYTIINGGFDARPPAAPTSGTTKWVTYPQSVVTLEARGSLKRPFTVTVPAGTKPGEYITGLVIENSVPVKGKGAIALNQVIRTAIAVAIRVPGPLKGGLAIGAATHQLVGTKSVVHVEVTNTGNRLLKPLAAFMVRDAAGKTISSAQVQMGSFYAGTTTAVELPLAAALQPGTYTISLSLTDAKRATTVKTEKLTMEVAKPEKEKVAAGAAASSVPGTPGGLAKVAQTADPEHDGLPVLPIAGGVLLIVAAAAALLFRRRRGSRSPAEADPVFPEFLGRQSADPLPVLPVHPAPTAVPADVRQPAMATSTTRDILPGR